MSGLPQGGRSEQASPSPKKRPPRFARWAILLAVVAGISYAVLKRLTVLPVVQTATVTVEELWTSFTAEGVLKGTEYTAGSETGGRVVEVLVREGDEVEKGQVVFRLNTDQTAFALEEAEQAYRSALAAAAQARQEKALIAKQHQANLAAAKSRVTQAEAEHLRVLRGARSDEIEQAVQRVARAKAGLEEAERAHRRAEALYRADAISKADLERAEALHKSAEADVHTAEAAERLLRSGPSAEDQAVSRAAVNAATAELRRVQSEAGRLEVAAKAVEASLARVGQASAAVRRARASVQEQSVHAPSAGTVTKLNLEEGSVLLPGQAGLVVSTRKDLRVEAEISTEDTPNVTPGMEVIVTAAAYPGRTFKAKVRSLMPTGELKPDAAIRTRIIRARIGLLEDSNLFRPGMEVDVEGRKLIGKRVTVPTDAVRFTGSGATVLMIENGRVAERQVRIGTQNADRTEIISGLSVGETVILRGKDELKPGDRIQAAR